MYNITIIYNVYIHTYIIFLPQTQANMGHQPAGQYTLCIFFVPV